MDIRLQWDEPFDLVDGSRDGLIYDVEDFEDIPDAPGIYIFARMHGASVSPLYIGRATSLSTRIEQQLYNNVRLMTGLANAQAGYRILLVGQLVTQRGQRLQTVLDLIESALIQSALVEGFELLNVQGTRTPVHSVTSSGNRDARSWLPSNRILLQRGA